MFEAFSIVATFFDSVLRKLSRHMLVVSFYSTGRVRLVVSGKVIPESNYSYSDAEVPLNYYCMLA